MIKFDLQRFNGSLAEFGLLSRADKNFIDSIPDTYATKNTIALMQDIINSLLDRVSILEDDGTSVEREDILSIVNGTYTTVEDSEGITEEDIQDVLLSITSY